MRRFIRILARAALGILIFGFVAALVVSVTHGIQLHRVHRLSQTSAQDYIVERAPYFVLSNARVIDGTGSDERKDESLVVRDGKIAWVGASSDMPAHPGAKLIDLHGATIIPGLVMLHEHLFTSSAGMSPELSQQSTTFPLLYLAAGVTTARTAGSLDPDSDLQTKRKIDSGAQAGPELFLTAPYLEGAPALYPQMHALTGPDDAKKMVDTFAAQGFTSFKAYADITPDELQAAIAEAHAKSAKITGHLCTITFTQAADMGIDNLEHGLLMDTEFFPGKRPNVCPPLGAYLKEYRDKLDVGSPAVIAAIDRLIAHHVALTSTLAVSESELVGEVPAWYQQRERDALTWQSWFFARLRQRVIRQHHAAPLFGKAQQFEVEFVRRGGTLLAGADPTGDGSVLAGFADLREVELLVQAGFTPAQVIQIATQNGAQFLDIADRTGTIEAGKQADFIVIDGDPTQRIADIRNVRTVYRQGKGYDSKMMMDAVAGIVGTPN